MTGSSSPKPKPRAARRAPSRSPDAAEPAAAEMVRLCESLARRRRRHREIDVAPRARVERRDAFAERVGRRRRFDDHDATCDAPHLRDHLRVKARIDLVQVVHRDRGVVRAFGGGYHRRAAAQHRRGAVFDLRDRRVVGRDRRRHRADLHRALDPRPIVGESEHEEAIAWPKGERIPDLLVDPIRLALKLGSAGHRDAVFFALAAALPVDAECGEAALARGFSCVASIRPSARRRGPASAVL
ncbi:hypothetical protein [Vulcanimicrobium alpinum]|uniref:hypothetical protein n=1 Tax=Vulcanimicrobium alpinum TaxID=3016050 RepID=UPI00295E44E8|nr:hypothetical protein [Vulcanimicrobium alpinum]